MFPVLGAAHILTDVNFQDQRKISSLEKSQRNTETGKIKYTKLILSSSRTSLCIHSYFESNHVAIWTHHTFLIKDPQSLKKNM